MRCLCLTIDLYIEESINLYHLIKVMEIRVLREELQKRKQII